MEFRNRTPGVIYVPDFTLFSLEHLVNWEILDVRPSQKYASQAVLCTT